MDLFQNKKKMMNYAAIVVLILTVSYLIYYFFFNVYEVVAKTEPEFLYTDRNSTVKIEVVPVNALGSQILFRKVSCTFDIREGKELVEVLNINENEGMLLLGSKGKSGKVVIVIHSKFSLLPMYLEIEILPTKV